MAYRRVILDSAEADRDEIVEHLIESTGSTKASAGFLDSMDREVGLISELPAIHALSRIPAVAKRGYRVALLGSYAMPYRFEDDTIYIAHAKHVHARPVQQHYPAHLHRSPLSACLHCAPSGETIRTHMIATP